MFGRFDHIGLIVGDLDAAVSHARERFGLDVARTAVIPEFGIDAVFLGEGNGSLELFVFADPDVQARRLEGLAQRLDHVAFEVDDLDSLAVTLRASGVRFTGPTRREELVEPFPLGPTRHLWTLPETSAGLALQFIERSP